MTARPASPLARRAGARIGTTALVAAAICLAPTGAAFAAGGPAAPAAPAASAPSAPASDRAADRAFERTVDRAERRLAATPWVTSGAVDQDGDTVALDDPRAANFVGNAYFKADGTFTMYNLDDSPKMRGDWEMRLDANGDLTRWIAAKNSAGAVLFERTVPIVALTGHEFTYRVVNAADPSQWVDIIHTPTDHAEPGV